MRNVRLKPVRGSMMWEYRLPLMVAEAVGVAGGGVDRRQALGQLPALVRQGDPHQAPVGQVALAADLRHALVANELVLYYQPQVDLVTGAVLGAEALLRWRDPERGLVPPMHFIPLAEQSGLILEITPWVVKDALRQVQVWREGNPDLRVSVNVAMRNLHDPQFVENIETLVESSGVPARALTLEITEGTMMLEA